MFRIGDFSRLGQVSTRMLRHYDKLGLLSPSHVDRWTGYRYYTIDQLGQLHRIIALKEMGLRLEQIGELMKDDAAVSPDRLRGMLTLREAELRQELSERQRQLRMVEARLRQIEQSDEPSPYEVVVKELTPQPLASLRQLVPHVREMGYYCERLYGQLYDRLDRLNIRPAGPEITCYHNEEYTEVDLNVETGVAIAAEDLATPVGETGVALHELPAVELAASLIYEGDLSEITPAVFELLRYVGVHNHAPAGPLRELHLSGVAHPEGEDDSGSMVVELQLPITPL